jgi:hypothetical protein
MSGLDRFGRPAPTPSAGYAAAVAGAAGTAQRGSMLFCLPMRDASVQFSDASGNAAHGVVEASNSKAFALPGKLLTMTSPSSGVQSGVGIPAAKIQWNPRRQSMLFGFEFQRKAPAANEVVLCVSGGSGAAQTGFYLSHRAFAFSGKLLLVPTINAVATNTPAASTAVYSEASAITVSGTWNGTSATDTVTYSTALPPEVVPGVSISGTGVPVGTYVIGKAGSVLTLSNNLTANISSGSLTVEALRTFHVGVAYDALSGVWSMYRDGVVSDVFTSTPMTGANAFPDANVTHGVRFGGQPGIEASSLVNGCVFGPSQMYVMDGGLPANVGQLMSIMANAPRNPLPLLGS